MALNTLCKAVSQDTQAIQRHRNTVVDCLKDADISIRRRALDLIYALVTPQNVKALVKELLNYLSLTTGKNLLLYLSCGLPACTYSPNPL